MNTKIDENVKNFISKNSNLTLKPEILEPIYEYYARLQNNKFSGNFKSFKKEFEDIVESKMIYNATLLELYNKYFNNKNKLLGIIDKLKETLIEMSKIINKPNAENNKAEKKVEILKLELDSLKKELNKKNHLLMTDELTQVGSRNKFNQLKNKIETVFSELNTEQRTSMIDFKQSLVIIDIDHFKKFNDTYGHDVGDNVLKHVAKTIKDSIREVDEVVRFGGEEFVIFIKGDEFDAQQIAQRVNKNIKKERFNVSSDKSVSITVSAGVAQIDGSLDNAVDNAFKKADNCLYYVKENGRNGVATHTDISFKKYQHQDNSQEFSR